MTQTQRPLANTDIEALSYDSMTFNASAVVGFGASSHLTFGSGGTVVGGTFTSTLSPSLVTSAGGNTAITLANWLQFQPVTQSYGSVGGATDSTSAFNNTAARLYRTWGDVFVPASSSGYTLTPSSLIGWTPGDSVVNWNFWGGTPAPTTIPGAVFQTGIFPSSYTQSVPDGNARTTIMQRRMFVSHIPSTPTYWWDGYHVEAFLDDNSVANPVYGPHDPNWATTQREARCFSANVGTNANGALNGEIRAFKGLTYATGGNANLRSVYGYSSAVLGAGFTGQLTGLLGTVITNGNAVAEAIAVRGYAGPGSTAAFQAAGGINDGSAVNTVQYGFMMRPQTGQPLVAYGAQYMGWGGSGTMADAAGITGAVGDFLTMFASNTDLDITHALYRVDQNGFQAALQGTQFRSGSAPPTTTQLTAGMAVDWKNTSDGTVKRYVNDGGTLKSITYS